MTDETADAYISIDRDAVVTAWNQNAEALYGWTGQEALGVSLVNLIIPEEDRRTALLTWTSVADSAPETVVVTEHTALDKWGNEFPVDVFSSVFNDGSQVILQGFHRDSRDRKREEAEHEFQSTHDSVTGLPNRRALLDELEGICRRTGNLNAVLSCDIDRFEEIATSVGPTAANQILRVTAQRLKACVRTGDVVSRINRGEFVVVLHGVHGEADAVRIADKIREAVSSPHRLMSAWEAERITMSIGIAIAEPGAQNAEGALDQSRDALDAPMMSDSDRVATYRPRS